MESFTFWALEVQLAAFTRCSLAFFSFCCRLGREILCEFPVSLGQKTTRDWVDQGSEGSSESSRLHLKIYLYPLWRPPSLWCILARECRLQILCLDIQFSEKVGKPHPYQNLYRNLFWNSFSRDLYAKTFSAVAETQNRERYDCIDSHKSSLKNPSQFIVISL